MRLFHSSLAGTLLGILAGWFEVVLLLIGEPFQKDFHLALDILPAWAGIGALGGAVGSLFPSREAGIPGAASGLGLAAVAWALGAHVNFALVGVAGGGAIALLLLLSLGPPAPWVSGFLRPFPAFLTCILLGIPAVLVPALHVFPSGIGKASGAETPPHVLLVVLDSVPATSLRAYDYYRTTSPRLDILAGEGALFEKVWTSSTHPRQALEDLLGASSTSSLPRILHSRGWATGAFLREGALLANPRGISRVETLDRPPAAQRSKIPLALNRLWPEPPSPPKPCHGNQALLDLFLGWFDTLPQRQPFFALLHLPGSRFPYSPLEENETRFLPEGASPNGLKTLDQSPAVWKAMVAGEYEPGPGEVDLLKALHDAAIRSTDATLGELVEALREREILDQTLLVITSLGGQEFGRNGRFGHGSSLGENALHVPFLVRHPASIYRKTRVGGPVSLAHCSSGIQKILDHPGEKALQEKALEGLFGAGEIMVARSTSGDFAVSDGHDKLVLFADGSRALVDMLLDPEENALGSRTVAEKDAEKAILLESLLDSRD